MGMSFRARISTFVQPCQEERTDANARRTLAETFLVRYGEGKRTFTDGADARNYADARDGVEACEWLFGLFDESGGADGASPPAPR